MIPLAPRDHEMSPDDDHPGDCCQGGTTHAECENCPNYEENE